MQLDNVAKLLYELQSIAEEHQREAMTMTDEADLIRSAVITYGSIQSLKIIEQEADEWNLYAQARQLRETMEDALSSLDPLLQEHKGELPDWWVLQNGGYMEATEDEAFEVTGSFDVVFVGHIANIDCDLNKPREFKDACCEYVRECLPAEFVPFPLMMKVLTIDKRKGTYQMKMRVDF